jgi:NADH dehydrogenase FAD-containing subunit
MKRVIIIGCGYAGYSLARSLDQHADVVVVEPRDAFLHNVAAIRAVTDPALLERIILPYGKLLKRGKVMRGRATAIEGNSVRLASGGTLEGDVIVIATGSGYARPFKPESDTLADFAAISRTTHEQVRAAKSIAIVGAGTVGTELAGEIAVAMPGKKISLISSAPKLFPTYPEGLGRRLQAQLKALHVDVVTGTVKALESTTKPFKGRLELGPGQSVDADIVFPAIGSKADGNLIRGIKGAEFDNLGRLKVDGWLRPAGLANVFVTGDAVSAGDYMSIVAIMRQQPWLTKAIRAALADKKVETLPAYAPWPSPPVLVPLGPRKGASVLPVTKKGLVVGSFLTSAIKGKNLFIPRYHHEFGVS